MRLTKCADMIGRLRRVGLLIAIGGTAAIVGSTSGRAADACASLKRPACPYPKKARYTGSGDTNAAASFVCE